MVGSLSSRSSVSDGDDQDGFSKRTVSSRSKDGGLEDLLVERRSELLRTGRERTAISGELGSKKGRLKAYRGESRELDLGQQLSDGLLVGDVVPFDP